MEQIEWKDWKPSINVYTPWIRVMNWRRKQQNAFDLFLFLVAVQCIEPNAQAEGWRVWKASRSQSVRGSRLPINTFHAVRQCQVCSVDCVALR